MIRIYCIKEFFIIIQEGFQLLDFKGFNISARNVTGMLKIIYYIVVRL